MNEETLLKKLDEINQLGISKLQSFKKRLVAVEKSLDNLNKMTKIVNRHQAEINALREDFKGLLDILKEMGKNESGKTKVEKDTVVD